MAMAVEILKGEQMLLLPEPAFNSLNNLKANLLLPSIIPWYFLKPVSMGTRQIRKHKNADLMGNMVFLMDVYLAALHKLKNRYEQK
jgi:hypothetical protein